MRCPTITGALPRCGRRGLGEDAWAWVLGGGEDHALVATFPGAVPAGWRRIGTVVDGPPRGAGGRRRVARKSGLAVVLSAAAR